MAADWLPALISSSDSPDHAYEKPCGSARDDSAAIVCSAWPELYPGAADPLISAERNRLKCEMHFGAVDSLTETTLLSGAMRPPAVRTAYFSMSPGFDRYC